MICSCLHVSPTPSTATTKPATLMPEIAPGDKPPPPLDPEDEVFVLLVAGALLEGVFAPVLSWPSVIAPAADVVVEATTVAAAVTSQQALYIPNAVSRSAEL